MPTHARRKWPGIEPGHTFRIEDLAGRPAAVYARVSSAGKCRECNGAGKGCGACNGTGLVVAVDGQEKSTGDQVTEGLAWAMRARTDTSDRDIFKDPDRSASRWATRARDNFNRLREAIEAGRYQIIWFWATSRQTRGDVPLDELAGESAKNGVLWCVNGQMFNPANEDDYSFLLMHYIMNRQWSWRISKDSTRGHKSIALAGKPHGRTPYGYRRVYDPKVMIKGKPRFIRDEPDTAAPPGHNISDSPAYVVREIFDRLARGEGASRIARALEDRRVPRPAPPRNPEIDPCRWTQGTVKFIAQNPAYIGKRIYQQESWRPADRRAAILPDVTGLWEPLVTDEQFWAVQRILARPKEDHWRPSGSVTLLAGVARCGECHAPLRLHKDVGRKDGRVVVDYYVCSHRSHVGMRVDWLDEYVEDRVLSWASDPRVYEYLWGRREDDNAAAVAARADVERLTIELEQAQAKGRDPKLGHAEALFWAGRVSMFMDELRKAGDLAMPPSLDPLVAGIIGPGAVDNYWKLRQENLPAARQFIKLVADIRVHSGVRGGDRHHARLDPGRISWAWLTGPGDHEREFGEPIPRPMHRIGEALRADPWKADRAIGDELQSHKTNVGLMRRKLEEAGEIPVIRRRGRGKPVSHGYRPAPETPAGQGSSRPAAASTSG